MNLRVLAAEATDLFVGGRDDPRQVVRVTVGGGAPAGGGPVAVTVEGAGVTTPAAALLAPPGAGAQVEVGVAVAPGVPPGARLAAEAVAAAGRVTDRHPFELLVAEPGWTVFMVSHFHYDPVWWNTQAAYTQTWRPAAAADPWVYGFQGPAFALVRAHLDLAARDPAYKFVLAELDYLKPYWDAHPEDRPMLRTLLASGRLELVGGAYNEPNTNLTAVETTIRNLVYGTGYQRDVLGGEPATAWQLDAFGHDPQFPGLAAAAGLRASAWARGPFHGWGPRQTVGDNTRMQFPSEFEWIAPSGLGLLTSYMPNQYTAGWWMDLAPTLAEAEAAVWRAFQELRPVAATRNVLLPVGMDSSPPNRWLLAIQRDWNRRYTWPRFVVATPGEFFAAVRADAAARGVVFTPQTRDMNAVYTGKDVSYADTKQAQRAAEVALVDAEKLATVAALHGARYPTEAVDKAWRQLLFGAHHDGITGTQSDQVYLDLLAGWREAHTLARGVLHVARQQLAARVDTGGPGRALLVWNTLSWPRGGLVRCEVPLDGPGVRLLDAAGAPVPFAVDWVAPGRGGRPGRAGLSFLAADVPALGYRTWRAVPSATPAAAFGWRPATGTTIENQRWLVEVDPARGGAIARLYDKQAGKELLKPGGLAGELLACQEYPDHPKRGEGPWHLAPTGAVATAAAVAAEVRAEVCPLGRRLTARGRLAGAAYTQELALWDGAERLDARLTLHGFRGHDLLFRVRVAADVAGGMALAEVGDAVVGRSFGFPTVDVAEAESTLDNPARHWFGLGATAAVRLVDEHPPGRAAARAARAVAVAEVVLPHHGAFPAEVRRLVVALVRAGVTSTVSAAAGSRYGSRDVDSNLPDVRIAVGGPADNAVTAAVLAAADPAYAARLAGQLAAGRAARLWLPAARPLAEVWTRDADLRGPLDLPVLIVAGADAAATAAAVDALAAELDRDRAVTVAQPAGLDGTTGRLDAYTVAVLNRGSPGCAVTPDGELHLSLLRSCTGWPSALWIDPPRRTTPDGAGFQLQHWSHTFEYALAGGVGDWRAAGLVRAGHEYNHPLEATVVDPHPGELPAAASFLEVEPARVVLTALKPAGNPIASAAGTEVDPAAGIALRCYEAHGRPATARVRAAWPLRDAARADLLERPQAPLVSAAGAPDLEVRLDGFGIGTVVAVPQRPRAAAGGAPGTLGPRAEPAQPVFARWWLHNKGAAPLGYLPVSVMLEPGPLAGSGPWRLRGVVASEHPDRAVGGVVELAVPDGWRAQPPTVAYRLGPGDFQRFESLVAAPPGAAAGRWFLAARVVDQAGQVVEDVVGVDLGDPPAGGWPERPELEVRLRTRRVRLRPGGRGRLLLALRNHAAGEVRGEAQLISPFGTWELLAAPTRGFAVPGGAELPLAFELAAAPGTPPGVWWALVKLAWFGRVHYSPAVPLEVAAAG